MELDRDRCLVALRARDARFDGRFFAAVRTTLIYCRPVCPARPPKAENITFFACAAAAEAAGYRPCRRCRPETAPGTPAWLGSSAAVARALRLLSEGALDRESVAGFAGRLGVGPRHLRRLFDQHLGASPIAIAQTRRVHFAKQMLDETDEPIGRIVWAAGFGSVRRFQDVFRKAFGRTPGEVRALRAPFRASGGGEARLRLRLGFRPPLDWDALLGFLAPRAFPGVEQIEGGVYRRVVRADGVTGVLEVAPSERPRALTLSVPAGLGRSLLDLVARTRRLFDLDADPAAIAAALARDPRLAPLVRARPGLRVPGSWDPFETAVRAVLGQQVTVKGATTLSGRLVQAFGEPLKGGDDGAGELGHLFPTPERLMAGAIESIGIPRARAQALRGLAQAVVRGPSPLERPPSLEEGMARLEALPGIGPWTAAYVAMRALGEPDAFPAGDLALRRALQGGDAEAARPFRAYAAMHLWMAAPVAAPRRRTA